MNIQVYNFLKAEAEADKAKALASLHLLTNHPAGIGDHSTKDYWGNCNESIKSFTCFAFAGIEFSLLSPVPLGLAFANVTLLNVPIF